MKIESIARAACLIAALLALGRSAAAQRITAEPAEDWTALFNRTSGWTGADGTYSVPLSGRNWFGGPAGNTLFLFSDTFIGEVNEQGERLSGTKLVNNTAAIIHGRQPRQDRIDFYWGDDGQGGPAALIIPNTPNSQEGDWYWVMDGFVHDRQARLFMLLLRRDPQGAWMSVGVSLVTLPLDSSNPLRDATQLELPIYHIPADGRGHIYFGNGIFANTEQSGAPHPDGYVYVYGGQHDFIDKKLVVARIRPEEIEDPAAWRFWDGAHWQEDIDRTGVLFNASAGGASIVPMPDGRLLMVYLHFGFTPNLVVRTADTPTGPFSPWRKVYRCPEPDLDPELLVYGARAHPHLSGPGELLVSYNVNCVGDFWRHFREADIYRPRFVRLRIE